MHVNEFWLREIMAWVQRIRDRCERCSRCGAIACGPGHEAWHVNVNQVMDNARDRIIALEQTTTALTDRVTAAETAITNLTTRVTGCGCP